MRLALIILMLLILPVMAQPSIMRSDLTPDPWMQVNHSDSKILHVIDGKTNTTNSTISLTDENDPWVINLFKMNPNKL
jgi:hypothetical protein